MADDFWQNAAKPPEDDFWAKAAQPPAPRGEMDPIPVRPTRASGKSGPGGVPIKVMPRAAPPPSWASEVDAPEHEDNAHFSASESALNGAGQAVTLDHADELAGLMSAHEELGARMRRYLGIDPEKARFEDDPEPPLSEVYAHGRDVARAQDDQAKKDNPWAYRGGAVAGDVLAQTGLAIGTGGLSMTPLGQGAIGVVSGEGSSNAPLASASTAKQAGIAGGIGLVTGKAGEFGSELLKNSRVGRYLGGKVGAAEGDAVLEAKRKAEKLLRGGVSKVGGETTAGRNAIAVATEILSSPHATPKQVAEAKAFLASPEAAALLRGVYDSALEQAPSRLGAIERARAALPDLQAGASPAGVSAAAEEALSSPISKQVVPRIKHVVNRLLPHAVGAVLGGQVGHPYLGTVAGGVASLVLGHQGTTMANMLKSPAVRRLAWSAVERAITSAPEALGKFGPFLAREYARDPDHARAVDEALTAEDPEYAARKLQLLRGGADAP